MSAIQQELAALGEAKITPAVLGALDYVVPGEWHNSTSLEQIIEHNLEVTDPTEVAAIKERAEALYGAQPHYARALSVYRGADTVDRIAAAAVIASQMGSSFAVFKVLDRFTPKPDTTQAIDAALKLTAEFVAFAQLRGIPVASLQEAKAFPATLATYAKADMMRIAAWLALDGLVPLGPDFLIKVKSLVSSVPTAALTSNTLFQQLTPLLPKGSAEDQKGFILGALDSASDWVSSFVSSTGLTQEGLVSSVGGVLNVADSGLDVLAATLDATTNYFEHTGVQSVARVLVHDAQQSLADGEAAPEPVAINNDVNEPEQGAGRWFKTAAMVGAAGAAGMATIAIGSMLFKSRAEAATPEEGDMERDVADLGHDDDLDDDSLDGLTENQLGAREAGLQMNARRLKRRERMLDRAEEMGMTREEMMQERKRLRRQRMRRRRGMGGGGRGGRGGGGGGRGGGGGGGRGGGRR